MMVESEKDATGVTVNLPSASHKSDAKLKITPSRRGFKKYKIWYSLEDGGSGFDTVITITYRTAAGGGSRQIWNRGPGTDTGTVQISASKKITSMSARVERVNSHEADAVFRAQKDSVLS